MGPYWFYWFRRKPIEGLGFEEVATRRRRDLEQKEEKRNRITEVIFRGINIFVMKRVSSHASIFYFTVTRR